MAELFYIPNPTAVKLRAPRGRALCDVAGQALLFEALVEWQQHIHDKEQLGRLVQCEMLLPQKFINDLVKLSPVSVNKDAVNQICCDLCFPLHHSRTLLSAILLFDQWRVDCMNAKNIEAMATASRLRLSMQCPELNSLGIDRPLAMASQQSMVMTPFGSLGIVETGIVTPASHKCTLSDATNPPESSTPPKKHRPNLRKQPIPLTPEPSPSATILTPNAGIPMHGYGTCARAGRAQAFNNG
jgi:hypothetical protein